MGYSRRTVKRYARNLRRHQTLTERRMWGLIFLGFFAQRTTPINYVADYYNPFSRVIVEIDGGVHDHLKARDNTRDKNHRKIGIYTIRITTTAVLRRRPLAYAKIIIISLIWQGTRWYRL